MNGVASWYFGAETMGISRGSNQADGGTNMYQLICLRGLSWIVSASNRFKISRGEKLFYL